MQNSCEKSPFHIQNHRTSQPVLTNGKHPYFTDTQFHFCKDRTSSSSLVFGPCSSSLYISCSHLSVVLSHNFLVVGFLLITNKMTDQHAFSNQIYLLFYFCGNFSIDGMVIQGSSITSLVGIYKREDNYIEMEKYCKLEDTGFYCHPVKPDQM